MTNPPNRHTLEGTEQLKKMGIKPLPEPDDLTSPYWAAAKKHELRIQRCTACEAYQHPPQPQCGQCGASEFEWPKLSGQGTVYSFFVDRRLMTPGFDEPYVVAQINPIEAQRDTVRITANIRECELDQVSCEMPVEVIFEDVNEAITLPQFRPASGSA